MNSIDIARMSDEQLLALADKTAKAGKVKGTYEDDTVLWQLVLGEVSTRLSGRRAEVERCRSELAAIRATDASFGFSCFGGDSDPNP